MIYLKPSKRWWKKIRQPAELARGALIFLALIILFVLNAYPPEFLRPVTVAIASPFWQARDLAAGIFQAMLFPFTDKKKLFEENAALKLELAKKNLALIALEDLVVENQELKELGGRELKESFVLAAVLNRPPVSSYDTLIIDAGSNEGIAVGDIVAVEKNSVIGEILSVAKDSATVSLYSTPNRETPVAVGLERAEAPARGRGAGNFEVRLPKGVAVEIGDAIILPGINHRPLGFVSKIETSPNDPFQTILFDLPINLNTLRFVMILKK